MYVCVCGQGKFIEHSYSGGTRGNQTISRLSTISVYTSDIIKNILVGYRL